ncbi:biosynthetic peptidoglycan transglycosylase [Nannocystis sp.]|uniref:transglycosylase domain-containing protein n=1 Tax=Nannocystis sp. TaxID=1962667 RepID=UPI0025D14F3B|nr:biosynthetic peptidoglycan transglycosylase [Nannocystis sp.]MBK7823912.1 transglycosylase domain-containing protein [Nannocystis sp.]
MLVASASVATYPIWADSLVEAAVVQRLERLTGTRVTIESFDLEYSTVAVRGVSLAIDAETSIDLDAVDVSLDQDALWSGRAIVTNVAVHGGTLRGDVATFERVAADVSGRLGGGGGGGTGRVKIVPQHAQVRDLKIDLRGSFGDRSGHLGAVATSDVTFGEGRVELLLRHVDATLGERALKAARLTTTLRRKEGFTLEFPLRVEIEGGATAVTPQIAVSDIRGSIELADMALSTVSVDLAGSFSDEPRSEAVGANAPLWTLKGTGARDLSAGSVTLTMAAFKLGRIPAVLAHLPVVYSEEATVGGDLTVRLADGKADVEGDVQLAGLNIDHPLLARQPVLGVGFAFNFTGEVDPAQRRVVIAAATLRRGGLEIDFDGEIVHAAEVSQRRYRLHVAVPKVTCQEVIAAIPAELAPSLVGFELKGDFELDLEANIDLGDLEKLSLTGRVDKDKCKVVKTPALVSATRLSGAFVHRVTMRDGSERTVDLREGSSTYTPLDQISPNMIAAVMTTEDGGFWKHKGFITSQFQAALRRNLEAGKVRLGASTITMQMVKNVLLSHERTLSRKLQEMFLTWYVEQSLSKERIMEVYLNVIEFGPGVYGVTRASAHYFGKAPADLTPPEAAYLALMLPSPVRRHVNYCEGGLTPVFQAKMKRLLGIMQTRGRLDPATYEQWKDGIITFDTTELVSKKECLAEIQRLLAASEQQRSLSGLLDDSGLDDDAIPLTPDEGTVVVPVRKRVKTTTDELDPAIEALGEDAFLQAGER